MDVGKILAQLRGELDLIEQAIANLEKMERRGYHRRSRPLGLVTKSNQSEIVKVLSKESSGSGR
jgi:hypothetical protein